MLIFNQELEKTVNAMAESLAPCHDRELEKEIIDILIESELYFDMDLSERYDLFCYLSESYYNRRR